MTDVVASFAVILAGLGVVYALSRREDGFGRGVLIISYAGHVVSALGQVWITKVYYGGTGDMSGYEREGRALAELMNRDLGHYLPKALALILNQSPDLPWHVFGAGGATGAMAGFSGLWLYTLGGSLYAACIAIGALALAAQVAIYRALVGRLAPPLRRRVMVAILLIPSVVFWSSGMTKEAYAIIGLGLAISGAWAMRERRWAGSLLKLAAGGLLVALVKPYILFAFVLSLGLFVYWGRAVERSGGRAVEVRPLYLALVSAGALLGLVLLGQLFPEYAVDAFADRAAYNQEVGRHIAGGSNYQLGDPGEAHGLGWQLLYSPLALATALFRPLIVEARNPLMLLNGLETTAVIFLFVRALTRRSWVDLYRWLRSSPTLVFCMTFTLTMGVAVGLATTNLGTLSRYRAPMFPFFGALLLVLTSAASRRRRPAPAGALAPRLGRPAPRRRA